MSFRNPGNPPPNPSDSQEARGIPGPGTDQRSEG